MLILQPRGNKNIQDKKTVKMEIEPGDEVQFPSAVVGQLKPQASMA